jgi:hypothetical protein
MARKSVTWLQRCNSYLSKVPFLFCLCWPTRAHLLSLYTALLKNLSWLHIVQRVLQCPEGDLSHWHYSARLSRWWSAFGCLYAIFSPSPCILVSVRLVTLRCTSSTWFSRLFPDYCPAKSSMRHLCLVPACFLQGFVLSTSDKGTKPFLVTAHCTNPYPLGEFSQSELLFSWQLTDLTEPC